MQQKLSELDEMTSKADTLNQMLTTAQNDNAKLCADLIHLSNKHSDEVKTLNEHIASLESQLATKSTNLEDANDKICALEKNLLHLQAEKDVLQQELTDHKKRTAEEVSNLNHRISVLETQVLDEKTRLSSFEKELSEEKSQVSALEKSLSVSKEVAAALKDRVAKLTESKVGEVTQLQKELDASETQMKKLQSQIAAKEQQITSLDNDRKQQLINNAALIATNAENEKNLEKTQNALTDFQHQCKELNKELIYKNNEITKLQQQIDALGNTNKSELNNVKVSEPLLQSLYFELFSSDCNDCAHHLFITTQASSQRQIDELNKKISELQAEIVKLSKYSIVVDIYLHLE